MRNPADFGADPLYRLDRLAAVVQPETRSRSGNHHARCSVPSSGCRGPSRARRSLPSRARPSCHFAADRRAGSVLLLPSRWIIARSTCPARRARSAAAVGRDIAGHQVEAETAGRAQHTGRHPRSARSRWGRAMSRSGRCARRASCRSSVPRTEPRPASADPAVARQARVGRVAAVKDRCRLFLAAEHRWPPSPCTARTSGSCAPGAAGRKRQGQRGGHHETQDRGQRHTMPRVSSSRSPW